MSTMTDDALMDRFLEKIIPEPNSGCWLWTGAINKKGYARFNAGKGESSLAHRTSVRIFADKEIPEGFEPDHKCKVRCCVNPDHLEVVTHRVNLLRGNTIAAKSASSTHCPKGHAYTNDNLVPSKIKLGLRECSQCSRDRAARYNDVVRGDKPKRAVSPWSCEEIGILIEMKAAGASHIEIAERTGRSKASVEGAVIKSGIPRAKYRERA